MHFVRGGSAYDSLDDAISLSAKRSPAKGVGFSWFGLARQAYNLKVVGLSLLLFLESSIFMSF